MDYKRMELELRCMVCNDLFKYPLMLPCGHNVCAGCTEKCMSPVTSSSSSSSSSGSSPQTRRLSQDSLENKLNERDELQALLESDGMSMVSDADSGVVCGSSHSGNIIHNGNLNHSNHNGGKRDSLLGGSEKASIFSLTCPQSRCGKVFITDEPPGKTYPANRLLMKILSKYSHSLMNSPVTTPTSGCDVTPVCQLCETEASSARLAVVFCQQCEIFYCPLCRDSFHPQRGPLTTHKLLPAAEAPGLSSKDAAQQQMLHNTYVCAALEQQKCPLHNHDYTMYCSPCRLPLCWKCLEKDTFHQEQHDVQSLQGLSKGKKVREGTNCVRFLNM